MSTVWNPSDLTNITLSDSNHVATSTAGGNDGVRAFGTGHDTGLWYLEYSAVSFPSNAGGGAIGFGFLTDPLGASGQFAVSPGGQLNSIGGGSAGTLPSGPPWAHMGFAINFNTGFYWVTLDGTAWTGDGTAGADPVAGTHGRALTGVTGGTLLFPMIWLQNLSGSGACTINAGDRSFQFSVPSGFTAWDSPPPPFHYSYGKVIS